MLKECVYTQYIRKDRLDDQGRNRLQDRNHPRRRRRPMRQMMKPFGSYKGKRLMGD
ncbi:hypothetical protein L1049_019834 [Liquidambar formosana]|uniref:Uncharacterized protein n=1 Tax=Liquidambar formosana TaxID=63359 RepID=A0AAP0S8U3_LIQFO